MFRAEGDVYNVILKVASESRRPIGNVANLGPPEHCDGPISVLAGSLRSALDMISAQCPGVSWHRVGESIVVQLSRIVNSPLDVAVASYSVKETPLDQAIRTALELPEIRAWLKDNGVSAYAEWVPRGFIQYGKQVEPKKEELVSLSVHRLKFAELLDAIASSAGGTVWSLRFGDHGRQMWVYLY